MTENASVGMVPIVLTMGEPGGVGGEVTAKAWSVLRGNDHPFFVCGAPETISKFGAPTKLISDPREAEAYFREAIPILPIDNPVSAIPGTASPENADAVIESIRTGTELTLSNKCSALVTNPVQKSSLIEAGFPFPGHTEYLAHLCDHSRTHSNGSVHRPVMMLASAALKTVPVTIHQSVFSATQELTIETILATVRVTHQALKNEFSITDPRIVISGLNPHAGENGAMGSEEIDIVIPAIKTLKEDGFNIRGPMPADTLFHAEARETYDVAICMLHDQALIPVKTLGFHDAVNTTLGLPIVRTSPDHGTALDIAGKGTANPSSLIAAIRQASAMARNRNVK